MAEEIIQIKVNYESKDIRDLVNSRSKLLYIFVIAFILFLFTLSLKHFLEENSISYYSIFFIISILVVLILSHYIVPKRVFKHSKLLQEELTISFTNESIKLERTSASQDLKWDYISKLVEYKKFFVIYDTKYTAISIPKRFFKNEQEIIAVKNLLKKNLSNKNLKLLKN